MDLEPEPEPEQQKQINKKDYRKMNIQQLKNIVISNKISSDIDKLKKNELIALIEKYLV